MSDDVVLPEVPPEAPLSAEEKVNLVKNNLRNQLATCHNNLFNFISGLPINEDQKKFALANLIQGLHWAQDGIDALQFEVENMPPAPPAPEQPEVSPPTEGEPQC